MTYVVTEVCIKCKYTDCVEVCPVDCFYEGENMLVIHPDECIDCGVCEPECPVDAIKPDTEPDLERWLEVNRQYSETWPNITTKKPAPADADAFVSGARQVREILLGRIRAKGTSSVKGLSVNPIAKMSHVAAQKRPCCGTERLPDSLRLCYLAGEMAQTAGALSIERGVPARARFFSLTEGG